MGVPRETVDLRGDVRAPRLIANESGLDRTAMMNRVSDRRVRRRDLSDICGFILKAKSPTCGLEKVKIYGSSGRAARRAQGLFAAALVRRYPSLPVVEERQLYDAERRENFILRVFAYRRARSELAARPSLDRVRRLHERERCLLDAHSRKLRLAMDRFLASPGAVTPALLREKYVALFMQALTFRSTPAKNARVMKSILSSLRPHLSTRTEREAARLIDDYRAGRRTLAEPLALLRKYADQSDLSNLHDQSYLDPDEREADLRFRM
jgi:uncharacterized protein YbgA (DUF1722 family)